MNTAMTQGVRPRFRTDLVAEPINEDGKRFIDVFDPDTGSGYRFYEVEYSLACAMDGERDVAGLVRWAREELGVEPSARELQTVISTLGDLGYLSGAEVGELASGVISGPAIAPPRVEEVELGTAGGAAAQAAASELPHADVELGQAGGVSSPRIVVNEFGSGPDLGRDDFPQPPPAATPVAELQRRTIPDQDHDGPTDLPRPVPLAAGDEDMSTDLSDHLAISASDVKEAVRASRVMAAVEIPADIAATIAAAEAEQEARAAAEKAAAAAAAAKAAAEQAAAEAADREAARAGAAAATAEREAAEKAAAEKAAAVKAAAEAAKGEAKAVVKPTDDKKPADKKPADKKPEKAGDTATAKLPPKDKAARPVEPPVEQPRTSRALIFLLVLVILLAGTYLVWTQLLKKPLPWEKSTTASTQPAPPPPAPPPPPPPPSATLSEQAGATTDVAAGRQGVIEQAIADGSSVAVDDELVRFIGNPALSKQLAVKKAKLEVELPKAIADLTAKRDAATAANKPDVAKTWQDKLDKQTQVQTSLQAEVDSLNQQLAAFAVKAPIAGTAKIQIAKGAKVTANEQVIASITGPTVLTARFTASPRKVYSLGDVVQVTARAGGQPLACKATAVDGGLAIECPLVPGGPAGGAEVILP